MLDGLDEDWNYVGQQRSANYTNIKPGDYIFSLKAAIMMCYWTNEPKQFLLKFSLLGGSVGGQKFHM